MINCHYIGIFLFLSCFILSCNTANNLLPPKNSDNIHIVSVIPDSLLVADSLTKFFVRVSYDLISSDSAILELGFNDDDSIGYTVIPAIGPRRNFLGHFPDIILSEKE